MRSVPVEGPLQERIVSALSSSPLFVSLSPQHLGQVASKGELFEYEPGEAVVEQGEPSDSFFLVLGGECAVKVQGPAGAIDAGRVGPPETLGEMGLLLGEPRSATVEAATRALLLRFGADAFAMLYERVPGFGVAVSRALARRLAQASRQVPLPSNPADAEPPPPYVLELLPVEFQQRHRVLPLRVEGNVLALGFVDDPTPAVLAAAREQLPGMDLRPVRIDPAELDRALRSHGGLGAWRDDSADVGGFDLEAGPSSPRLDQLLRRMVAEGASDLHLSAGLSPRWRIDGEVLPLQDLPPLGEREVYELLEPVMDERNRQAFHDDNDADFAYQIAGVARFRVNLFRDHRGTSAVFRQIPAKIIPLERLGMPPVVRQLCEQPKGLVLVTGPTGSGKSTTLAAMVDYINKSRRSHIITLEDPIEFVHQSQACLVNQREVGSHTKSFARALKAALREDPDIVLVGEMRDLETVQLALETANTGHLVFGTLHTATAVSTVDRIIDLFPAAQQNQIRAVLADTLKGVVAQTLLKRAGGGRVAALEALVVNHAVSNLIREAKTFQIASIMSTGKQFGNMLLNDQLATLVSQGVVTYDEALSKAVDKADLARKCGKGSVTQQMPAVSIGPPGR